MKKIFIFLFGIVLLSSAGYGAITGGSGVSFNDSRYVNVTGDTMTGTLTTSTVEVGGRLTVEGNSYLAAVYVTTGLQTDGVVLANDNLWVVDDVPLTLGTDSDITIKWDAIDTQGEIEMDNKSLPMTIKSLLCISPEATCPVTASTREGTVWYSASDHHLNVWNGSAWVQLDN